MIRYLWCALFHGRRHMMIKRDGDVMWYCPDCDLEIPL